MGFAQFTAFTNGGSISADWIAHNQTIFGLMSLITFLPLLLGRKGFWFCVALFAGISALGFWFGLGYLLIGGTGLFFALFTGLGDRRR